MKKLPIAVVLIVMLTLAIATTAGAVTCTPKPNGQLDPMTDCFPPAICDGYTDDGAVLEAAMTALNKIPGTFSPGGALILPAQECLSNRTLQITNNKISITCASAGCTLLTTSPYITQIDVSHAVYDPTISGINLRRHLDGEEYVLTPQPGANAINFSYVTGGNIHDVYVYGGYNGVVLSASHYSQARNLYVEGAVLDGIVLQPDPQSADGNNIDWALDRITVRNSGRYGIHLTNAGALPAKPITVSQWSKITTGYNHQGSVRIESTTGNPINDINISNSMFKGGSSNAAGDEISINTANGINNAIHDSIVELALGGSGIVIEAANDGFIITGTKVYSSAYSGIRSVAANTTLTGCETSYNNGNGVRMQGSNAVISGLISRGNGQYGLYLDGDDTYISGGDLNGNTAGTLRNVLPLTNSKICAVKGVSGYCR